MFENDLKDVWGYLRLQIASDHNVGTWCTVDVAIVNDLIAGK